MCALCEYDIMRSTGKLRFARGTHENLIYQGHPPGNWQLIFYYESRAGLASFSIKELHNGNHYITISGTMFTVY